ncbi:MAG TPA: 2,3-diphosphoglycerate synthetase [Actinomycetota bacterium]|nr:2,3-diphosphoglycerate synthetase [Actinomycetota bacterium]
MRYVVVIDGEHYPPVVQSALDDIQDRGHDVVGAVLAGGREKLPKEGVDAFGDVAVRTGDDPRRTLQRALDEWSPDCVLDLSDEPVLDYRRRHQMVSVALVKGIPYEGADFRFTPPPRPRVATKPSLGIIGTGKRTGKTAIGGFAARALTNAGHRPVIVSMGRGGPEEPEVMHGDEIELTPADLLELADSGKHAASDYIEDALLGRVQTVGCRRCGGGLAGAVEFSNVPEGVRLANGLDGDLLLFEGSGSAMPPVHSDATGLIMPASIPPEYLLGYMGPYRLLLSDFVVVTMCEEPFGSPSQISEILSQVRKAFRGTPEGDEIRVVRTIFRPAPTRSVEGKKVFVGTTAPKEAARLISTHLEEHCGCEVVGITHALSDRAKLEQEIADVQKEADILLCEIKAAGIDVATRAALAHDLDVVYMDNVPVGIDGDDPSDLICWAGELAKSRFTEAGV